MAILSQSGNKKLGAVGKAAANAASIAGVGFAQGGYTGPGGVNQPAGTVHKGEVVWSQADIRRAGGVDAVYAMPAGQNIVNNGVAVGQPAPGPMQSNQQVNNINVNV